MPLRRWASIAAAVTLLGCTGPQRPADVVVFASGTDLESANPLVTIHPLSRQVQRYVLFVTLARYDETLRAVPYFARGWSWSPDRRTLDLVLLRGLSWDDGVATTARDVVFTLDRARDPATGYARAADLAGIDTIRATSDTSVQLRFASPQRDVPSILCELPIVPEHVLRSVPASAMRRSAFGTRPVSNGPFRFVDRVAGQRWTFARNERFPAVLGGPPRIRQLVVAVVDEPTTKFAGLASGDLDFAGIAPTMAALAERDPLIRVIDYPILFSTALVFNAHRPPFDDARVRRAVDLSLDRERIVRAALAGYGTPAAGPVPPENPLAVQRAPGQDVKSADSLLDAAGWRRARDGWRRKDTELSAVLLTVGSGDNAIEQLVQADLGARGIRLEIRQMELAAFLAKARAVTKDFDVLITGVSGDLSLGYLGAMYDSRQRGGALDYGDFHTAALDALFARAREARSDSASRAAWQAIQDELARQTPAAWIYHSRGLQGVSARMRDVAIDLRGELSSVVRWSAATDASRAAVGQR